MAPSITVTAISGQGIAVKAVEIARLVAGKPYIWGGKTLDGFDCSGYVSYVLKELFPNHSTQFEMNVAGYLKSDLFEDIEETDAKPGDIIIFPASGGHPNHVGIVYDTESWLGSQSSGVGRVKFSNSWWGRRKRKFRRLKTASTASIEAGREVRMA